MTRNKQFMGLAAVPEAPIKSSIPGLVLGLLLACLGAFELAAQTEPTAADNAELVYQLQQLQEEVRQLRGLVEQQAFELENIQRRQRDQYLELDQRLTAVSAGADAGQSAATAATAAAASKPNVDSDDNQSAAAAAVDLPKVRQPLTDQRQVSAVARPEIGPSATIAAPPASEQQAYAQAFDALKALRYSESAGLFRNYLQQYPDSDLSPNAQYWLGESYYASGNYDLALDAFNDLLEKYPDSSKTGDALLKVGYTYYEKQDWNQARAALEQVKLQHAGSALERLADSRLRAMRADGRL